jgi:nitrogen regulatory protein PII
MRLFFYVLNKTEYLDDILEEFAHNGINGATVIESTGMARILSHKHDEDELPFLASLRNFLTPERESSNVIFTVIQDDQLNKVIDIIEKIVGDLSKKNNGIVFSFPIDYTKGIVTDVEK